MGRRGSALLSSVLILLTLSILVAATLPLASSGYALAREERDRALALAAAEAGVNWQIARVQTRRWGRDDGGRPFVDHLGQLTRDLWKQPKALVVPETTSEHVLLEDADDQWAQRFRVGVTTDLERLREGDLFAIISEGQVRAPDGRIVRRRIQITAVRSGKDWWSLAPIRWWRGRKLGHFKTGDWEWREVVIE
jgi:hypothetical protein